MLDASTPLTAGQWLQWRDPHQKAAYEYTTSYPPYDDVVPKADARQHAPSTTRICSCSHEHGSARRD